MGLLEDLLLAPRVDGGGGGGGEAMAAPDYAVPPLSPTAASVVHRCARYDLPHLLLVVWINVQFDLIDRFLIDRGEKRQPGFETSPLLII